MSARIVNLNISELIVSSEPLVICTVLGSCVSVCLFTESGLGGGMIHYALAELPQGTDDNLLRYGDYAVHELVAKCCDHLALAPRHLRAKLVGGANTLFSTHRSQNVGRENVKIAKDILSKFGIPIIAEDTGHAHGRKILFNVQTGRLQVAFVGPGFTRPSAARAILRPPTQGKKR